MAMALSQQAVAVVRAHGLHPAAASPQSSSSGFASHSGLYMRRLGSFRSCAVAAGGLLGLPIVTKRRVGSRVLCAVVDGSGDESDNDASDDAEKQISSLEGAAASVDSGVSVLA